MVIQRIFYPIGQGAFYAEKHSSNFNIVYDCGTVTKKELIGDLVEKSFNEKDRIDILFISHFDIDHVNKIDLLKKTVKNKIDKVVLPFLHDDEKILLSNIYRNIEPSPDTTNILVLINNPQAYFGDETSIITVNPGENNNSETTSIYIDNLSNEPRTISSGTRLAIRDKNWVFIPHNHKYSERRKKLEQVFLEKGIDINELLNSNLDYMTTNRSKINEAYNAVGGDVNENSMMLYSGPAKPDNMYIKISHKLSPFMLFDRNTLRLRSDNRKVACIYTGDADLKKSKIHLIYKALWKNVGTIQIPHHASFESFSNEFLEANYICPISAGISNKHEHPHQTVVNEIKKAKSYPKLVTEDVNSQFAERIIRINNIYETTKRDFI